MQLQIPALMLFSLLFSTYAAAVAYASISPSETTPALWSGFDGLSTTGVGGPASTAVDEFWISLEAEIEKFEGETVTFPPSSSPEEYAFINDQQSLIPEAVLAGMRAQLLHLTDPGLKSEVSAATLQGKYTLKCETTEGSPLWIDVLMCASLLDARSHKNGKDRCYQSNPFGSHCTRQVWKGTAAVSLCCTWNLPPLPGEPL